LFSWKIIPQVKLRVGKSCDSTVTQRKFPAASSWALRAAALPVAGWQAYRFGFRAQTALKSSPMSGPVRGDPTRPGLADPSRPGLAFWVGGQPRPRGLLTGLPRASGLPFRRPPKGLTFSIYRLERRHFLLVLNLLKRLAKSNLAGKKRSTGTSENLRGKFTLAVGNSSKQTIPFLQKWSAGSQQLPQPQDNVNYVIFN